MADAVVGAAVIKRTQQTLGKYVKKPALSEKLLRKPPFRFLHDVFCVVIKETGCFAGLYSPEELEFNNIKDREDKMRFLNKMIDVIKLATGATDISVRASKIVCGHEPEKTNELLQLMGEVIDKSLDWQSAVEQVRNGEAKASNEPNIKIEEAPKETKTKEKAKVKSKEVKGKKEEQPKRTTPTTNKKEKVMTVKAKKESKTEKAKSKNKTPSPPLESTTTEQPVAHEKPVEKNSPRKAIERATIEEPQNDVRSEKSLEKVVVSSIDVPQSTVGITKAAPQNEEQKLNSPARELPESRTSSASTRRSTSAKKTTGNEMKNHHETTLKSLEEIPPLEPIQVNANSNNRTSPPVQRESTFTRENSKEVIAVHPSPTERPRTSLRPPSARAASARPGAPRKRNRNVEIRLQPNDEVKTDAGINVKLDSFLGDEDGEQLVIIEDANADSGVESATDKHGASSVTNELEQQGHLVQQILETQKELVQQTSDATTAEKRNGGGSATLRAGGESSALQMHNLRDVIQNLTKSVNPFGKLLDFLPEDTDSMQLELGMWREAYQQAASELKREQSLTESTTEPMKNQLMQIEANVRNYEELIDASRVKILQNSEKILRMLTEQ